MQIKSRKNSSYYTTIIIVKSEIFACCVDCHHLPLLWKWSCTWAELFTRFGCAFYKEFSKNCCAVYKEYFYFLRILQYLILFHQKYYFFGAVGELRNIIWILLVQIQSEHQERFFSGSITKNKQCLSILLQYTLPGFN
jgi:hypothetical protein